MRKENFIAFLTTIAFVACAAINNIKLWPLLVPAVGGVLAAALTRRPFAKLLATTIRAALGVTALVFLYVALVDRAAGIDEAKMSWFRENDWLHIIVFAAVTGLVFFLIFLLAVAIGIAARKDTKRSI